MSVGESSDPQSALHPIPYLVQEDEDIVRHHREIYGLLHQNNVFLVALSANKDTY